MKRSFAVVGLIFAAALAAVSPSLADGAAGSSQSGTYAGARIGFGWVDATARAGGAEQGYEADGAFMSLVLGHDYTASGPWVLGAVLDVSAGNERGSLELSGPVIFKVKQEWEASLRGRVGYRMDGFMPYATAGISYGSFETQYSQVGLPFQVADSQAIGWTLGAGVDVPVNDRWTLVAEYRYTDYGDEIDAFGALDGPYDISSSQLYLGANYRF